LLTLFDSAERIQLEHSASSDFQEIMEKCSDLVFLLRFCPRSHHIFGKRFMLTHKQHELLLFIHQCVAESGIPPSFDEMKKAVDIASKSGVHRLIVALEERGFIRRLPNRARALEIIKLPSSIASHFPPIDNPKVNSHRIDSGDLAVLPVPVVGRIAAGMPIAAIQHQTRTIPMPLEMLGQGEHYALEVRGDSMIDAGILDGDIVIIQQADTAQIGEIVVALVDGEEATLKYYRRKGPHVVLEAANPTYAAAIYDADRVHIQGRLAGLVRHY